MIICIIDEGKDKENLEKFFISHSKEFKFLSSLQDGIHIAQEKSVEYIVIDTDKEPVISSERLNIFTSQSETPCVVLTNNQTLSAKIRGVAKKNKFLTTALYGNDYPNLKDVISFKKKFKNKSKVFNQEKVTNKPYDSLRKSFHYLGLLFLFYLFTTNLYALVTQKTIIKEGYEKIVLSWFILGFFGMTCFVFKIVDPRKHVKLPIAFCVFSIVLSFFKFKFFLPMLVISIFFGIEYYFNSIKKVENKFATRKETRYKVEGFAYVISSSNLENFNAQILDLSNSGALLESHKMFVVGEEIKINNDAFSVFGEVKRSFKFDNKFRAGVEFHLVTSEHKNKIQEYIAVNRVEL